MTIRLQNAPWRTRTSCVNSSHITAFRSLLLWLFQRRKGKHIRQINDHLARDIGLGPAQMERHRMTWPSQTSNHPRL